MRVILIFFSLFLLASCEKTDGRQEIQIMLERYYESLLLEELDESMDFIHPENEDIYKIYQERESVFREFEYKYTIKKMEFATLSETASSIKVLLNTSGIEEKTGEQQSYDLVYTYELKKDSSGNWKIFSEQISPI